MVAEAERPIVIGGRGATWSGAKGALEALAEESGALLATTLLGKGLFDGNPFALDIAGTFATDLGRELFAESDLVIAAGAGLGHYTTEGGYLFPNAKVVRIDTQPTRAVAGAAHRRSACPGRRQGRRRGDRGAAQGKGHPAVRAGAATRSPRRSPRPPRTRTPSPIRRPPARSTRARWSRNSTRQCQRIGTSSSPAATASALR